MKIHAKCGNRCDICPAFTDNIKKYSAQSISAGWQKYLGFYLPPEEIECAGCLNEGHRPGGDCAIRKCCFEKSHESCADCADMICPNLQRNIDAMERLEKSVGEIPEEIYEVYFRPYQNKELLMKAKNKMKEKEQNV